MKKCVFAGTFDPPTTGHKSIISQCLKIFDGVTVAVMINAQKSPVFTAEERKALLEKLFDGEDRVKVIIFDGAVVDLLKKENTPFYVRGVRNTIDFEYENMNFFANKKLMDDIITVYLPADQNELHISSTLVKNSFKFNKDFTRIVPAEILGEVTELLKSKQ